MYAGFRKDLLWSFIAEGGARIGSLALFVAFYPLLGAAASGVLLAAYALAVTVWLFIDLGLGLYGTREIAAAKENKNVMQIEISIARGVLALAGGIVFIIIGRYVLEIPFGILIGFTVYLCFRALAVDWRLKGDSRFKDNATITLSASVVQILVALLMVRPDNWQYFSAMPWAAYALVHCLGSWRATYLKGGLKWYVIHPIKAMSHLGKSYGYSLSNGVSVLFQQSPVLILTAIFGASAVAGFALLHRVILSSVVLFQILGNAAFPHLVKTAVNSTNDAWKFTRKAMIMIAILSMLVFALGAGVASIQVIKDVYLNDIGLIVLAAFGVFFVSRSIRIASARHLLATNMQTQYAFASIVLTSLFFLAVSLFHAVDKLTEDSMAILFMAAEIGMLAATMLMAKRGAK